LILVIWLVRYLLLQSFFNLVEELLIRAAAGIDQALLLFHK
jgi:hypothetical protein